MITRKAVNNAENEFFSPNNWLADGHFFVFKGDNFQFRIFYRDTDDRKKPALVLLHGFPTSSWDWHQLWPQLSEHFRLICLDFLGYGYSDKPQKHEYTFFEQADIVTALLEHLDIEQYHMLAHDYGDTVAQELLAREIENPKYKILSTVLLNGGIIYEAINFSLI